MPKKLYLFIFVLYGSWLFSSSAHAGFDVCAQYSKATNRIWHVAPKDVLQSLSTSNESFVSLTHALENVEPGDSLVLSKGEYRQVVNITVSGLTIKSKHAHEAKIIVPFEDPSKPIALKVGASTECTTIRDLDVSGGYYYAVSLESDWTSSNSGRAARHVQLVGNIFSRSGRDTIKLKPMVDNVSIIGNHIHSSGLRDNRNAEGIDIVNGHNLLIAENLIEDTATTGAYVKGGSSNAIIVRNYLRNTGNAGILLGFDTSPQFFNLKRNSNMYEAIDSVAAFNIIENSAMAGIGIYSANNVRVFANTLSNVARKGQAALLFGISYQDRIIAAKRPSSENITVFANIIHGQKGKQVEIRAEQNKTLGYLSALKGWPVMFRNLHAKTQNAFAFQDKRFESLMKSRFIADWQKHIEAPEAQSSFQMEFEMDKPLYDFPTLKFKTIPLPESTRDFCGAEYLNTINVGAVSKALNEAIECQNQALKYL